MCQPQEIKDAPEAFEESEPRDLFYRLVTELVGTLTATSDATRVKSMRLKRHLLLQRTRPEGTNPAG
jgi:hypothetical protein